MSAKQTILNLCGNDVGKARAKILEWRRNIPLFCEEVLGFAPWDHDEIDSQRDVLIAFPTSKNITVRSGHKTGKSRLMAAIAASEYVLWPGSRTVLTAPTSRQVKQVVWRELGILYRDSRVDLGGVLNIDPATGLLNHKTDTQVLGFTTNDPDAFSGISGTRVTYLADEASGIEERIFEAIEGNRAGGARLVLTGNPTRPAGKFYNSHTSQKRFYKVFHIDSSKLAELKHKGEIKNVPGTATKAWADEYADKAGVESMEYQVRVAGNFPSTGADSVFSSEDVDLALSKWDAEVPDEALRYRLDCGLDVARFGDDKSCLVMRRGKYVYKPIRFSGLDGPQLANAVIVAVSKVLRPGEGDIKGRPKPLVRVDVGGVGASAYDSLALKGQFVDAVAVDFSSKAMESDRYVNRRAELWFNAAKAIKGMAVPPDDESRQDLLEPRYKFAKDNRMMIEPKQDIKKRIGRSPDYGDAFALCCDEHSAIIADDDGDSAIVTAHITKGPT